MGKETMPISEPEDANPKEMLDNAFSTLSEGYDDLDGKQEVKIDSKEKADEYLKKTSKKIADIRKLGKEISSYDWDSELANQAKDYEEELKALAYQIYFKMYDDVPEDFITLVEGGDTWLNEAIGNFLSSDSEEDVDILAL